MQNTLYTKFSRLLSRWPGDLLAILIAALYPLAFAPFHYLIISFICPTALIILLNGLSPKKAAWRGWLFGLGAFGVGVSWVFVSLTIYGEANYFLAGLITALMIMIMGSYIAGQCYLYARFFPTANFTKFVLAFPSMWVLFEWVRTWLFSGFPWLLLGNSHLTTPLRAYAPVFSVFGVSWIVAACCGSLVYVIWNSFGQQPLKDKFLKNIATVLMVSIFWIGGYYLQDKAWTQTTSSPLKVSLVQGNIPQVLKWAPEQAAASLDIYTQLTKDYLQPSQLIVWPESGITFVNTQAQQELGQLDRWLNKQQSTLVTGIPIFKNQTFYNGMLALGNGRGEYLKRHLVPFGEYMPFRSLFLWLKNYVQMPMSDFDSGPMQQKLITANGYTIAGFICYEIAYPSLVLTGLPLGQILITISDDSWFGKSIAAAQHLEIAQMRALETGRYLLLSTNDGITAIIDPFGRIQSQAPRYQRYVLTGEIRAMNGSTPWVILGIYPILFLLCFLLLVALVQQKIFVKLRLMKEL